MTFLTYFVEVPPRFILSYVPATFSNPILSYCEIPTNRNGVLGSQTVSFIPSLLSLPQVCWKDSGLSSHNQSKISVYTFSWKSSGHNKLDYKWLSLGSLSLYNVGVPTIRREISCVFLWFLKIECGSDKFIFLEFSKAFVTLDLQRSGIVLTQTVTVKFLFFTIIIGKV